MFERYNEKARRVIFFARYEASQFGAPYIETEHLLLGLLRQGKGALNSVLGLQGREDAIREAISEVTMQLPKTSTSVDLPLSNECKRILTYSAEESERFQVKHIGMEHLILGILREDQCLAAQILHKQGLDLDKARKVISRAKDQLARLTEPAARTPTEAFPPAGEEVPLTRRPVSIRVAITCGAETLLAYRSYFGPPRIGESILMRGDDGASAAYRVEDVVWEVNLNAAAVLRQVNVRVVKEEPVE